MTTNAAQPTSDFACILVPVDFSECSHAAVRQAVAMCDGHLERLHIMHVAEPFHASWKTESAELQKEYRHESHAHLDALMRQEFPEGPKPHSMLVCGQPVDEIINRAKELRVDLIVIGTHGRGGIKHMMMGSVAERVVRDAPCSVLVAR